LATGSEHRNFHGLVETLFWRLKGGTQHGGSINACVHAHKHSVTQPLSFFFSLSLTHKTHQQLGGGPQPLPYYHSNDISHIWAQMKTLRAATEIFILPVNGSILIVSLRVCRTLPPELMSCNWRCLMHQTSILLFCELQDLFFCIRCEDFQILVNRHYFLRSTVGFRANKWITFERSSTFK